MFIVSDKTPLTAVSAIQIKIYVLNKLIFNEENCSDFSKETEGTKSKKYELSFPSKTSAPNCL